MDDFGWAEINLTVGYAVPIWAIVKDWTEEERERLRAGDGEAREALEQQVITEALKRGDVMGINRFTTDIKETANA